MTLNNAYVLISALAVLFLWALATRRSTRGGKAKFRLGRRQIPLSWQGVVERDDEWRELELDMRALRAKGALKQFRRRQKMGQ